MDPLEIGYSLEIRNIVPAAKINLLEWTEHPEINIINYLTSGKNNSIFLPYCTLQPGRTYEFEVISYYPLRKYSTSSQFNIIITTNYDVPEALIVGASQRNHSYDQDLELLAGFKTQCPNSSIIYFSWSVEVSLDGGQTFSESAQINDLIGGPSENNKLVIPANLFNSGDILRVTVTVTYLEVKGTQQVEVRIVGQKALTYNIICANCEGSLYSGNYDLELFANFSQNIDPSLLTFNWTLSADFQYYSYQNQIKIFSRNLQDIIESRLQIQLSIFNDTHLGLAFYEIVLNLPPKGGSLEVSPSAGYSMETLFTISCPSWKDDHLPLTYQFFMSYDDEIDSRWTQLSSAQENPSLEIFLPGKTEPVNVTIKAVITDSQNSITEVSKSIQLQSRIQNLTDSIKMVSNMMDILNQSNMTSEEKIQIVSLLSKELSNFEQNAYNSSQNPCPNCNSHGSCGQTEICTCHQGWTLPDCSVSVEDFLDLIDLKKQLIETLSNSYSNTSDASQQQAFVSNLEDLSNPYFNDNKTLKMIQDILENTLHIDDEKTVLSDEEITSIANILSNLILYASEEDCESLTNFTRYLANKTDIYLNVLAKNVLNNQLTNQDATIFTSEAFDILNIKATDCYLQENSLSIGSDSPNITLSVKSTDSSNCQNSYYVQYYAFRDGLFDCSVPSYLRPETKSKVSLVVTDSSTGKDALSDFAMTMEMPAGTSCPDGCENLDGDCKCEELSLFNPKAQLLNIFQQSNLNLLVNADALLRWKFYSSFAFWAIVGFTIFYILTLDCVQRAFRNKCAVQDLQKNPKPSKMTLAQTSVLVNISKCIYIN